MFGLPLYPEGASISAPWVDAVYYALTAVTIFFSLLVVFFVVLFAVRYRRGHKVDRSNPPLENATIELAWTIIPMIICLGLFVFTTVVYFNNIRVPANAMEIYVVGKQWMWKLQQPNGRWEMNELHVPVGRSVKLTLISEDVIHDFFVPAFRMKQDVLPGRYVQEWFQATKVGDYHLFCAEFCGTNHSLMTGWIHVMEPADYERWLSEGSNKMTSASEGERLFRQYGCSGCHNVNSSVRAPLLNGIYGQPVAIEVPEEGNKTRVITADDRYIHDSIILPEKEIAAGYKPIMPSFKGRLSEPDVLKLIAYIKTLSSSNGTSNGLTDPQRNGNVAVDDVRTRAGFVPPNMNYINKQAQNNSPANSTYTDEQLHGAPITSTQGGAATGSVATGGSTTARTGSGNVGTSNATKATNGLGPQSPASNSPNNRTPNERTGR